MTASAEGLRAALNFTEADLSANRQGQLSIEQIKRLRRAQVRSALIGALVFLALVLASTALIYFGQAEYENNAVLLIAGLGLILLNALLVGYLGRGFMRLDSVLRSDGSPGVEALVGSVERVLQRGRQRDSYLIQVADQRLAVTKDIFMQFEHQRSYRIYRTRLTRIMLSAERVCEDHAPDSGASAP